MSEHQMLALNSNWLDASQMNTTPNNLANQMNYANAQNAITYMPYDVLPFNQTYYYYYPWVYPVTVTSPARPIKLTLSEVERLRKLAKADEKVKAILSKFTEQIEITVDFE